MSFKLNITYNIKIKIKSQLNLKVEEIFSVKTSKLILTTPKKHYIILITRMQKTQYHKLYVAECCQTKENL